MKRSWHGVLSVGVVGLVAAACATLAPKMSADEAIAARQKLMKEQGAAMKSIQDKIKAGQAQAIGLDAQKLIETSKRIPTLFVTDAVNPKTSRAKPEIWQNWPKFENLAKTLESKATGLAASSMIESAQATTAAVGDLGKTTCGACHDAFRGPEIKK